MNEGTTRILLFDDDNFSLSPLKHYLEQEKHYTVELTADCTVPRRLQNECFDLICIDLMIQSESLDVNGQVVRNLQYQGVNWQCTGLELLRRLRAGEYQDVEAAGTSPNVPVIILSAIADFSSNENVDTLLLQQPNICQIEKPFDLAELIDRIDKLIKGQTP